MLKRIVFLIALLAFFSCQKENTSDELGRWEAQAERVEIIRDDFGVPHIYGKSDADAVFGLLYAQCEDDFRRVERNYVWAIGRLAELEGEEALYSDLRANLYMTEAEAKAAYETAPDWLKELCVAFADGINYYLHTHPEANPQVITRYEPWMPMFFFEGSIGGDIESISTARLQAFYEQDAVLAWNEPADILAEPQGSNGIAIAPSLSESGNAMLLINPHTSFYFRPEVHVVSEEGLNVYGAVTWGQFFVYQGFNEKTGWIHTSTFVDFKDEFEEEIVESDGKIQYKYGEELRDVQQQTVTLKYKSGEELREKEFTFYRTHHGPITHKSGTKWVATKINWDPVNALSQSYRRTKLANYAEFKDMMNIRTNSSNNTVFADGDGNIAYFHGNFIPKRNPEFDFSKPVDGSNPATDWQGLHTVDESILILNPENGWIQNCNSTPFTAAGDFSPKREDFPPYMAPDAENFRAVHAVKVLKGAEKLNLDSFIELAYDPYLPAFEYLIPELLAAMGAVQDGEQKQVLELLKAWDYRTSKESVAMTVAHFYGENYQRAFRSAARFVNEMPTAKVPNQAEIREVFGKTIAQLNADLGTWNKPWGEVNRFQRLSGAIDAGFDDDQPYVPIGLASGNWGALAAYGARAGENTKNLYGYRGNSFVAVVEFGERVRAKSLLAGGQSGDPTSPHFFDQAQRYADVQFKEVAFYREDVEIRGLEHYRPGSAR
ncbi:acylase [Algoriphagus sp. H41]|uniref:Acylase n=1 Tax=Algoriphagus oliviformis TaxID=2811231 RepID=A0ABS3C7S8_9BACT|nr:acylase [Algoriphagus oliviformis]MBN7812624.1 acylase [Algoriphagus oliviformis]